MARIKLTLPEKVLFTTTLDTQIGHINYGGHLANDAVLSLTHEARIRFLKSLGCTEMDIGGAALIMSDAMISFRSEAFHGEKLKFDIGSDEISRFGFDLYYRISEVNTGREVAWVKTGMASFSYHDRKLVPLPESFVSLLNQILSGDGYRQDEK